MNAPIGPATGPMPEPGSAGLPRRLVCVSANAAIDKTAAVERLVRGEVHRPELLAVLPGGKAINVARAASLLGLPASVVAVLAGHAGDWIDGALREAGIPARRVTVPGESRTCLSVLDRTDGSLTEFYEAGVTLDGASWAALEAALTAELTLAAGPAVVVVSGSLPPGSPVDGYGRLARIAAGSGSLAAVDAGGAHLVAALPARPWLVKVNSSEAEAATGSETGNEPGAVAAARLRDAGAAMAIVTLGAAGAVLASPAGTWRIGESPERGRFGVGSGDAFLAGFLSSLVGGAEPAEAARHAAAVATAHALVPGQGVFRPEDVERILPSVTVVRIA